MKKYFHWLIESKRPYHILIVFFIGLTLGIEAVFAASTTAEFKDWMWNGHKGGLFGWVSGNGFDWLDFSASIIGGLLGWAVHTVIF